MEQTLVVFLLHFIVAVTHGCSVGEIQHSGMGLRSIFKVLLAQNRLVQEFVCNYVKFPV